MNIHKILSSISLVALVTVATFVTNGAILVPIAVIGIICYFILSWAKGC